MPETLGPAIVLAGSVNSSFRTLQALIRHRMNLVGVLDLSPLRAANVSGYTRMDSLAQASDTPYLEFEDINAPRIVDAVRKWAPDVFFIVGLSQLVKDELLSIPRLGCVGFHPTRLPEGRGRAPVSWMTLEGRPGAATFFQMNAGADAGPILAQEPFAVDPTDYASDVTEKLEAAIDAALDRWLPRLKRGEWKAAPQAEDRATFYGKRNPEDGLIDWNWGAGKIHALVRATSHPYPGAYTFIDNRKCIVWRAEPEPKLPYRGVPGRIVHFEEGKGPLVQTGDGLLWLTETEWETSDGGEKPPKLRVGALLGYQPGNEIHLLKKRLAELEARMEKLDHIQGASRKKP
jgi:methionyl-tRNA formyltransferase